MNILFSGKLSLSCFPKKLWKLFLTSIHALVSSEKNGCFVRYHHFARNVTKERLKNVKRKLSAVNGSSAELLSGYLDEYLWRERYGKNGLAAFENILSLIAEIYPGDREI